MDLSSRDRRAVDRWRPADHWYYPPVANLVIWLSRLVMTRMNRLSISGLERLESLYRRGDRGLLTFSNHVSVLDDPLLISNFGLLEMPHKRIRWVGGDAHILFGSALRAFLFSAGRVVPLVRGAGLDQPGLSFLTARLRAGHWVHIFPEGGANSDPVPRLRQAFKAGIGRLIAESRPLVLPFYHRGMQKLAPHGQRLRSDQRVEVIFGEPVDCGETFVARFGSPEHHEVWKAISGWAHGVLEKLEARVHAEEPSGSDG